MNDKIRLVLSLALFGIFDYIAYRVGIRFYFEPGDITSIWLSNGIALGVFLLVAKKSWPYFITLQAVVHFIIAISDYSPAYAVLVTLADVSGPLIAAVVILRLSRNSFDITRTNNIFALFIGILIGETFAAGFGSTAVYFEFPDIRFWSVWQVWWFADAIGMLLIVPAMVGWSSINLAQAREKPHRAVECLALLTLSGLFSVLVFGAQKMNLVIIAQHPYFFLPLLIWAALRFHPRILATILPAMSITIVYFADIGRGPFYFGPDRVSETVLSLQAYISLSALSMLALAAAMAERKSAERKLRQLNIELIELDEMKNNFLANVSHELRTPLVSIKGYAELLDRTGLVGKASPDWLKRILEGSARLEKLIEDLISIAKLERGQFKIDRSPTNILPLIDSCLQTIEPKLMKSRVRISKKIEYPLPLADIDGARIVSVLLNLLDNALKFSPEGGVVEIAVRNAGDRLEISVVDHGIGIADEYRSKIFNRFFQVDSSTTKSYGGAGIGLALAREIILAHGGEISVDSEAGKGSKFVFSLPIAAEPKREEKASEEIAGRAGLDQKIIDQIPVRVLVVDDDPEMISLLTGLCESESCNIIPATRGLQGLELLRKNDIDLIFLDIGMPDINGIEVCRRIKRDSKLSEIPIYILTAYTTERFRAESLDAGADGFLKKPYLAGDILSAIEQVRRRHLIKEKKNGRVH